ncbi:MAG: VCBS repeat-containing protein [Nevskia sp.]|nr:VCBS repeat-containing protein [Nevskia sp.]
MRDSQAKDFSAGKSLIPTLLPEGEGLCLLRLSFVSNQVGDTNVEPDEQFLLHLLSAHNAGPTPDFAGQQAFATETNPQSVAHADVNGDGRPDLLAANRSSNTVSVLLNTTAPGATTPSFTAQQTFVTGSVPYSVSTADVNGDGRPDLLVANLNSSTVSVLLNTTASGATRPASPRSSLSPRAALPSRWPPPTSTATAGPTCWSRTSTPTPSQCCSTVSIR